MKRPAIDQLVYEYILPRPKASDPPNFAGLLTRFLVFEVRQEVHSFYGHLDTQEAKYPGLDYCNSIHRIRLSRWPWHRRLFRAFDALRLTPSEIANLTKWEGTRWAKERYEKEQNITILDTAADGMPDYRHVETKNWVDEQPYGIDNYMTLLASSHPAMVYARREQQADECLLSAPETDPSHSQVAMLRGALPAVAGFTMVQSQDQDEDEDENVDQDEAMNDVESGNQDDSDDGVVTQSIGLRLNERLRERVAAHNAGDTSQPLDEDWEQWLKNALETGNLNMVAQHTELPFVHSRYMAHASTAPSTSPDAADTNATHGNQLSYSNIVPSEILDSARQGNWSEIPEFLHDVLRQTVEAEAYADEMPGRMETLPTGTSANATSSTSSGRARERTTSWRRTYSDLRLPGQ
ncbi:uncharacterized protein SPSK_03422 [Sporothrix schenckii 1099-18]|uniref:Uncharacterized protein n=1 Tax=Sporothrix schenckii 1099-18 TaxID=1397361 RepID=A0A0F2LXI9_SPOSC|nr:uncharacterized protein SPSK_03422 [Sporothrix schenckii 1099-18]KJR82178.1 hypothetical protein SPSK_03422 [Sporothrix schenckii 1099-18]